MSLASYYNVYKKTTVETASQGKLIVMLFNGAIQRAEEAKRQIDRKNVAGAHSNLIRAQDIVAELRSALNMEAGEVAQNLDRIYEYIHHLLVQANIRKVPEPLDESVEHLTTLRDTWKELFDNVAKDAPAKAPPKLNQHGSALMNLEG